MEPLRARGIELESSSFLGEHGMDVAHLEGAWLSKAAATLTGAVRRLRDLIAARKYDLVLIHRESLPVGPAWLERCLKAIDVPYVFDFDDAIYRSASSYANRRLSWLKAPGKTAAVVRGASVVIAGNQHLAGWARRYSDQVVVIPTTIDTDLFRPATRAGVPHCVGWTGSPSTVRYLAQIAPVLAELQRERGVRLRVIGEPEYRIHGATVESLPWRPDTELEDLSAIDIGVMPLPDDDWSRGKCGLKALQYMALGIPTVLSPVGVNCQIARDGAAILASTPAEWAAALRRLIDDGELRARTVGAGRERVEQEYSVRANLANWEHALRTAAERPAG